MISVNIAFLIVAAIICIGYFGLVFFKKTKVSEILVLMLIGLVLGPVFGVFGAGEISSLTGFLPFFASFALMIVLFEGGMQLNFFDTLKSLPGVFVFTIIVFLASLGLVASLWYFLMGNFLEGLLIGAVIGGTCSAVVIPLVNSTSAKNEVKTLLGLESALTDALCVVAALAVAGVLGLIAAGSGGGVTLSGIGSSILSAFSIAAILGALFGLVWIGFLKYFEKKPYEYLLTLAVLLLLYGIVEYFGASGAIAALVFGIVLGNSVDLTLMLKLTPRKISPEIKSFQMEVSFLVRTFFFVYLGLLFKPEYLNDLLVVGISFAIVGIVLFARLLGSRLIMLVNKMFVKDELLVVFMSARGLAAAGLMSFPVIVALNLDKFGEMSAIVFLVILISNILSTIGVFVYEAKKPKDSKPEKKASAEEKSSAGIRFNKVF